MGDYMAAQQQGGTERDHKTGRRSLSPQTWLIKHARPNSDISPTELEPVVDDVQTLTEPEPVVDDVSPPWVEDLQRAGWADSITPSFDVSLAHDGDVDWLKDLYPKTAEEPHREPPEEHWHYGPRVSVPLGGPTHICRNCRKRFYPTHRRVPRNARFCTDI